MLKVAEEAHKTDTGRQRHANEDSYFARAPLFAVADGMGGAQAGEVASRIAAGAFEHGRVSKQAPAEGQLEEIAQEANREIHKLAQEDSSRAGMGTTLTAAMVRDDEVALGHVGDSRAYVLRDGQLKRLTKDHSLVEELRRQGRLTEEQAEEHPQRSIITRALGPEPSVNVDTMTFPARDGDVFLLCSDGLTTMISDEQIREILVSSKNLRSAVNRLVDAANRGGGRDNITAVAFRLADAEAAQEEEGATLIARTAEQAGLTGERVRAATDRLRGRGPMPAPSRRRRALKWVAAAAAIVVVVGGAFLLARSVYFLGTDDQGDVALYRGLPYRLPLGISLYSKQYSIPVQEGTLSEERQKAVTGHELRGKGDATDLVDDIKLRPTEGLPPPPAPPANKKKKSGAAKKQEQAQKS
ncbi:MAG TPA: Stp1/IreP family PP2C-type Ser/Thr phosphatase [Solirubrobacterales bacterium]|jgi:PPM family protein phosphatase